jgi:hypothetical protein
LSVIGGQEPVQGGCLPIGKGRLPIRFTGLQSLGELGLALHPQWG